MNNSKGYVYIMDFGMFDEHHRLIKTGKSIDPKMRCGQHSKNGNKFLQGREGQVHCNRGFYHYQKDLHRKHCIIIQSVCIKTDWIFFVQIAY